MRALDERFPVMVWAPIAVLGCLALAYLVVDKEIRFVTFAILTVLFFLVCFSNIKISLQLLVFSMLLSPELIVGQTGSREITLRFEDALLPTMIAAWFFRMAIFKDIGFLMSNPLNRPIIVFSFIIVVSTALGVWRRDVDPVAGFFFTLKLIEYFCLFAMVVNHVQTVRETNTMITLMLIVFAIVALYALAQVGTGHRASAPFEGAEPERNTLSGYLVLVGSVAAGVFLYTKSNRERIVLGAFLALGFVAMLLSFSRSGWIASLVSVVVLFFLAKTKSGFLIVACLLVAFLPLITPKEVKERVEFTYTQQAGDQEQVTIFGIRLDTSTSARIRDAAYVMNDFQRHMFLGFGMTGFRFLDGQFIRYFIEFGVLGLVAFLWVLVGVHRLLRRALHIELEPRIQGMVVGFYAGFWALMAHALTANTFVIVRIAEPFWFLAGLTVGLLLKHEQGLDNGMDADEMPALAPST